MKSKRHLNTRDAKTPGREIEGIPVPDANSTLEELEAICRQAAPRGAVLGWLIGTAVNYAKKHLSAKAKGQWQKWQKLARAPLSYQTIRRYCQVARTLRYEDLDDRMKLQEAYDKAGIPTNSARGRTHKKARASQSVIDLPERDPAAQEPTVIHPARSETNAQVPATPESVHPDEIALATTEPEAHAQAQLPEEDIVGKLSDAALSQALLRLARQAEGGLEKIKELVDTLLVARSL